MILQVEHIARSYGRKEILRDISFSMGSSQLCGIVGENGSGKSTLMKIIVGDLKAQRGKVHLYGNMGYCPQSPSIFSQLTVKENFRYYARAYDLREGEYRSRMHALLSRFNFEKYANDQVSTLSGGTRQKLNLSIALLHKPGLLVLDEPYNGFDWETYQRFWDYTEALREEGCAILIVTHFLEERGRFDRIFNLENGCLA